MNYPIYITHELIMETTQLCSATNIKYLRKDFDRIYSIEKVSKLFAINGLLHLYGYKIAGEGCYSGFYDVVNQHFYSRDYIKNAEIIEHQDECIYESPVKPKRLRK